MSKWADSAILSILFIFPLQKCSRWEILWNRSLFHEWLRRIGIFLTKTTFIPNFPISSKQTFTQTGIISSAVGTKSNCSSLWMRTRRLTCNVGTKGHSMKPKRWQLSARPFTQQSHQLLTLAEGSVVKAVVCKRASLGCSGLVVWKSWHPWGQS